MPAVNFPTHDFLIDDIATWAKNNIAVILEIYSQKGGWEGWAQAELARAIKAWRGGSCLREYAVVYTTNDRLDILHENFLDEDTNNHQRNIIELKCQSVYQDKANIGSFATRYSADADKIIVANRLEAYKKKPNKWYVIGIAPGGTETGGAVAEAVPRFSRVEWAHHNSTYWTQRGEYSPVIFWTTY